MQPAAAAAAAASRSVAAVNCSAISGVSGPADGRRRWRFRRNWMTNGRGRSDWAGINDGLIDVTARKHAAVFLSSSLPCTTR